MKKLIQTRLHEPPQRGNCYPTVIACFLDYDSPEDVIQIQEYYPEDPLDGSWIEILDDWLREKGYEMEYFDEHLFDDSFYFATGLSPRGTTHICIYKNGKLWHDPHPDQNGLVTEKHFSQLIKV